MKNRTQDSLLVELDGCLRAKSRIATRLATGQISEKAYSRAYDMLLKQTAHVMTLLGVEGVKTYLARQEYRQQRKTFRKLRQVVERERVRAYGKPMAVAMSKEKAHLRRANGFSGAGQSISLSAIRRQMFGEE